MRKQLIGALGAASLAVALAGVLNPLHAAELQVSITGQGCVPPSTASRKAPCQISGPYAVSFDVDTLSGHPQESLATVDGVPDVVAYKSGPLSVTNFQESFNGKSASVRSTTGLLAWSPNPDPDLKIDTQNFVWDSGYPMYEPVPESEFTLAKSLMGLSGATFDLSAALDPGLAVNQEVVLENGTIRVTAVPSSVPEPATLALLGLGLVGLALSRRKLAHC